jgi:CheY-like chemotaxis protein
MCRMPETSAQNDIKKMVSESLKRVDHLIKEGNIDQSIREIIQAKQLDPKNIYIYAYEERLGFLKEEHEKNIECEKTRKEVEEAARKRDEEQYKYHVEEFLPQKEVQNTELGRQEIQDQSKHTQKTGNASTSSVKTATILVIDDDEELLTLITESLTSAGHEVVSLTTSDEAYILLENKWIPNLVLCDINLETSTMNGFAFYEKIREIKQLDDVPFIFLTGLEDELLAWKGRELGIDDYLTKPISEKHLLAAIKGRLKRFNTIRRKL